MIKEKIVFYFASFVAVVLMTQALWSFVGHAETAAPGSSRPEEIEWTWEVRPAHSDVGLPNILLVGDSITRNYFPEVTEELNGTANVYLFATSASVGDPRLPRQIADFVDMESVRFRIVHFNNGMHGWNYSEDEYRHAFPAFVTAIRAIDSEAQMVWATTTPVRIHIENGATNDRVNARNAIALSYVTAANIPVDDQHSLMTKHLDSFQDNVHFNETGARIQGRQAAQIIRKLLR